MTDIPTAHRRATAVLDEVDTVIVGKRAATEVVLAGVLAGGHVLMEDFPGLGKTLAARTFAQALGLDFTRAQFTPDLLPADLTGSFVYDQGRGEFEFRKGPVFTGFLLADEINRTPPKTQAALLEAMQEHQVTVEGQTFALPQPFHVLATANPVEYEGTYPLPEAQLDRFLVRVAFGYPDAEGEWEVLGRRMARRQEDQQVRRVVDAAELLELQASDGGRHGLARGRPLLRGPDPGHPRARALADGCLPARVARPDARGPGVRRDPRPRLRHPRRRQGDRPGRARAPGRRAPRAVDERDLVAQHRRRPAAHRAHPAHRGAPVVTSPWRPTRALGRATAIGVVLLVAAAVGGRGDLAVLGVPLVALVRVGGRHPPDARPRR